MREGIRSGTLAGLGAVLVLWASAFVAIRSALAHLGPGHLTLARFLVASAALGVYALVLRVPPPRSRDLPLLALTGLLGITIYHTTLNYGEVTVTAGAAALLVNTAPVFTALLATAFLGERLRPAGWVGIGVSFAGAVLIALGEGGGLRLDPGAPLLVLSALAFSVFAILQRPLLARYDPVQLAAWAIWSGTVPLLLFAPGFVPALLSAPADALLAAVYLGVAPSAVAYVLWARVLARVPASRAASTLYVVSPLTILIGWVLLGEAPSALALGGGALALLGVVVVGTLGREKPG